MCIRVTEFSHDRNITLLIKRKGNWARKSSIWECCSSRLLPFERRMLLDLVFDERVHEERWQILMPLKNKQIQPSFSLLINRLYLPRIQKIADPAPTIKSKGIQTQSTTIYCWDSVICRPRMRTTRLISRGLLKFFTHDRQRAITIF